MKLKKFFAGLMAVLMCFSGGHYVYAESEVKVTVCTPTGGTGYRYGYNDFSTQYDDSGNQYAMMTPGETYTSYVFTEAGYETYWYLCDSYISDPDEQNLIYRGQKYDFVAKASDDGKYLIAVIRVFDETFTVTVDTAGHGDNMAFNNVQGGTEVTTLINDAIADGQITHRDGDKIIAGFYLDSEYTKSPDLVPADEYRVNRNMTVYVKWADEIKKVDISVSNPAIGKTCVLNTERWPGSYSNAPEVIDNIGDQYEMSSASGGAFWFEDFDVTTVTLTNSYQMNNFEGEITAEAPKYANINLHAINGYMFTEKTEIYVNGEKVDRASFMTNPGGYGMGFGFGSFWRFNENFTCDFGLSFVVGVTPETVPDYCNVDVKAVKANPDLSTWTWFGELDMNYAEYTGSDIQISGSGKKVQGEKATITIISDGSKNFIAEISAKDSNDEFVNIADLPYEVVFQKGETSKTIEYTVPAADDVTIKFNIMDSLIMKIVNRDPDVLTVTEFINVPTGEPVQLVLNCADGYRLSDEFQFLGSEGVGYPAWNGSFFNPNNYSKINPEVVDTRVKNTLSWIAGTGIHEIYPNIVFVGYQSNDERKLEEVLTVDPSDNYQAPGIAFNNESDEPKTYTVELSVPNALTGFTKLDTYGFDGYRLMSGIETTSDTNGIGDVILYITIGKVGDEANATKTTKEVSNLSSLTITVDPGEFVTYSIVEKETEVQLNEYSYEITDVTDEEPVVIDKGFVYSDDTVKHLVVSDKIGITSVKLDKSMAELKTGESLSLTATINPEDTTEEKTLVWSSSDPSVATVSNGVVNAISEGTVVIKATAVNGVVGECLVTVYPYEMEDDAKFTVIVSSKSQQLGSVGSVKGTVYNDYHAELLVQGEQVNDGNVTLDMWMQNVSSLGVDSVRHYTTSIVRENGAEHALKTLTEGVFDQLVGKSVTGICGDKKATYTIRKAEGDEYKLIADINENDARGLWQSLVNEKTVKSYTGEDNSKITIAHGSWFNLGDEKLVFEDNYDKDLVLDDFSKLAEMKQGMKDALRIMEGDGSVTVYLEKGSILSIGESKVELLDDLRVTLSLDGSVYRHVFTEMSESADEELLGKLFGLVITAVDSLEDNTDVTFQFGHIITEEPNYQWSEDYSEVTATVICDNNPDHVIIETVKTTSEVTKPATCTAKGETTYTAAFENEVFKTQKKVVENIEATGHTPADPVKENFVEATCTQEGGYDLVVYCSVCGEKLSSEHVTVEKLPHTPGEAKHENEVEATCTEGGSYDEVVRCTVCGEILSTNHVTTDPLGHDWGEWVQTKAPTCKEKGLEERTCLRCGAKESRELDTVDHVWDEGTIIVDPTFSNTGLIEYKCTICGETKQEELPKGKVVRMNAGSEEAFTIAVTNDKVMELVSEDEHIANADVVSVGTMTSTSGTRYTRKIRVLGDSAGFTKIAIKTGESTLAYIYAIVSIGSEEVTGCVDETKTLTLVTYNNQSFKSSNPDVKISVSKEMKIIKVTMGGETVEAPAYYNTVTLTFEKPIADQKVTISTDKGDIYYINANISEHEWGVWKYDGEAAKTHTHVCSKDALHTETKPCEFDDGVIIGNHITYTCTVCGGTYKEYIETPEVNGVIRVAGDNRFGTSQKIAAAYRKNADVEKVDAVILANGDVFADALAGSYLAAMKDAPIIITRSGKEAEVNTYIRSILKEGGAIYVLGGTAAVPESCLNGLTGKGYAITRLWGNNRYLTNLDILDYLGVQGNRILVATGNNFADSLSASATGLPILLVKDAGLTDEQREFLGRNTGKEFIILGGTNAVNSTIESQLKSYGTVRRIRGDNRAKTSIEIAKEFFPNADMAVVAYSHEFPDGLCGGPLANQINAPLLLTRDQNADDTAAYLKSKGISNGYVLGGQVRLTDSLVRKVFGLDASDPIVEFK